MIPRRTRLAALVAAIAGTVLSLCVAATPASAAPMDVRVGTYNIKDPDAEPPWAKWDTRCIWSAQAIKAQGVKIAGIQELFESDERRKFRNCVNAVAGGKYYGLLPEHGSGAGDDSRILYDGRVFEPLGWGGKEYRVQSGSESRAFAWGLFRHRASGNKVIFVSTRLSPRSDTAIVSQWKELISWLNTARRIDPERRFIVTGDFNTTRKEPPSVMLAGMRSNGYEDVLGQIRNSDSTYRNPSIRYDAWICSSNQGKADVRASNCSVSPGRNSFSIDYIFVSKYLKAKVYQVYARPRTGYVMNYLPSDHHLVTATISE